MNQERVLTILSVRPARPSFETVLRETLAPDLRARRGLVDLWAGRRGTDDVGERILVALWEDVTSLRAVLGEDPAAAWLAPAGVEVSDARLEIAPVLVDVRAPAAPPPTIVRVARARLTEIDLATYAAHVDAGARRDLERGRGPGTLILAATGPAAFVTISTWSDWESLAAATGASLDRPVRTREQHAMDGFRAAHFELVPV